MAKIEQSALAVDLIRTDGGTQMRAALNDDVVADYRDRWTSGTVFDPIDVFHDGKTFWLADGFHRFFGAKHAKRGSIPCNVRQGSLRDAILFAVGANQRHGLRRSNDDKRNAVRTLLSDAEWVAWSDHKIAEQAGVSHEFVRQSRAQLSTVDSSPAAEQADKPRIGKDGKARTPPKRPTNKPVSQSDMPSNGAPDQEPEPAQGDAYEPPNDVDARMTEWNRQVESLARKITGCLDDAPSGPWLGDNDEDNRLGIALTQLKSAAATIRLAKCEKPCCKCTGEGCKACRKSGMMPKRTWEMMGGK